MTLREHNIAFERGRGANKDGKSNILP